MNLVMRKPIPTHPVMMTTLPAMRIFLTRNSDLQCDANTPDEYNDACRN